jgi:alpha-tubulin suppressor-like RCC1 family protein
MALNFPDNPSLNDTYADSTSGFTYTWNGTVWISVVDRKIGNIKSIDDISASFNGSETVFDLESNGETISPLETNKTIVSVGGVLQNPGDDYSVFGTQITFSTPPNSGLTFFGQVLQTDLSKSTLPDGSLGPEALSTGGFSWNSSGDFVVSGILTSGTSSVTLDGDTNQITVGAAGTINQSGIDIVGIITAGSFVGDGSNLTGFVAGIGSTGSVNTSGIITATSFTGDGRNLTDVGGYLAGLIYNPGIGQTSVDTSTGIGITFTKSIAKNTGVINLRENAIGGTIAESFDVATVGSSSTIAIAGATLTITPDSTLGAGTTYFVEVPANTVKDSYNTGGNLGITSFTFQTAEEPVANMYVMGDNSKGTLGQNDVILRSSPVQIPGTWKHGNSGTVDYNFGGVKTDGTAWTWGYNVAGELGLNDQIKRSSPSQIPGTQWSAIAVGRDACWATKSDGTLWAWGSNTNGQMGKNDRVPRSSPVQVPGTQWKVDSLQMNRDNVYAAKTDGTIWSWGYNTGNLAILGDLFARSSPIQIPGTQWRYVTGGYCFSVGIKNDGSLWTWGRNFNYGSLGLNQTGVTIYTETQIPGTYVNVSSTTYGAMASKSDGTLWAWGYNATGDLGVNNTTYYSSPKQIPGTQWSQTHFHGHRNGFIAEKTDNTVWAWGSNSYGKFGINDVIPRSSPVQIPGTQWTIGTVGISTNLHNGFSALRLFTRP